MQHKEQIITLIKEKPKHFSKIIKTNNELFSLIKDCYGSSVSEQIYNYLNPNQHTCAYNNLKKFASINEGYRNCGPANKCQCTREQVSTAVSSAKNQYTDEKKEQIQEKRKSTCLELYGVDNVGQTQKAISAHKALYENAELVNNLTQQIKNTKKEKYGDENYNNIEQIKKTWSDRYPVEYWSEKWDNEHLITLNDKQSLENLFQQYNFNVQLVAEHCQVHIQTVYKYLNKFNLREPFKSSEELELVEFIKSLGITNIVRNSRKVLSSKKELDIYLPDFNIAIEYNGVYWHHEDVAHITKTYHYDKFVECEKLGIQLITIFSNFWKTKKDIVKSMLINKLSLNTESKHARKCIIQEVSTADAKIFLNSFHIQGYTTSTHRYGLYLENELIALMTFGKTRVGIGKLDDSYELIRFASKYRVVGGASRLLNHFIRSVNPNKIISYSDNEWSTGNLYNSLGFFLEKNIPVSYWFLKPKEEKLYHRFSFAKHKLISKGYDPLLTEREITKQMGLLKVWDCGKKRWVLKLR